MLYVSRLINIYILKYKPVNKKYCKYFSIRKKNRKRLEKK